MLVIDAERSWSHLAYKEAGPNHDLVMISPGHRGYRLRDRPKADSKMGDVEVFAEMSKGSPRGKENLETERTLKGGQRKKTVGRWREVSWLRRLFFSYHLTKKTAPFLECPQDPRPLASMTSFYLVSALLTFLCPFLCHRSGIVDFWPLWQELALWLLPLHGPDQQRPLAQAWTEWKDPRNDLLDPTQFL